MSDELLEGHNISIFLNGRSILKSVSFSIKHTECIGLFGTSGAGKTTLLNAILGFHRIDHGSLLLSGTDVTDQSARVRSHANIATQHGSFYPKLTVIENLEYFAELYRIEHDVRAHRFESLIAEFSLEAYRDVLAEELSGGTQKRFEIALALLTEPRLLILDEPGSGLDIVLKKEIYRYIDRIRKSGTTVLLTSHDLTGVKPFITHFYIIHEGVLSPKFDANTIDDIDAFFSYEVGA
ncbi:MAG: ABC transporter ATP-binding protein [Candidatus Woesearchaeota archaeon]